MFRVAVPDFHQQVWIYRNNVLMKTVIVILASLLSLSCTKNHHPEPSPGPTPTPEPVIPTPDPASKSLYNGITLPSLWPPTVSASEVLKGMCPFYLKTKPDVIDITLGRQLFVDDFLISSSSVSRKWHQAEYYSSNPILSPTEAWEMTGGGGIAAPFSDGVWYDEAESLFKMWYMAGGKEYGGFVTCYAESADGIHWTKPSLNYEKGTNIVMKGQKRDASTIWIDKTEKNANHRYKMFTSAGGAGNWAYHYYTSSEGKYWREVNTSGKIADRSTVFHNPFRGVWVWSLRHNIRVDASMLVRGRDYMENASAEAGNKAAVADLRYFWFGPWPSEPKHPDYPTVQPAIYNLDAIGYESVMLGIFSSWAGPENDVCSADKVIKRNQLLLGYSRDGWSWYREDFEPFCAVSSDKNAWNNGNIQSAAGSPIIVGDTLYFYMSGRRLNESNYEVVSTGLATLRRDGFASMSGTGEIITEKLKYTGKYLFVNTCARGSLKIEILDSRGNVLKGFSRNDCRVISGDSCKRRVEWISHADLSSLNGQTVRIRFILDDTDLYAFWISAAEEGKSSGYTAGGGPSLGQYGIDL